MRRTLILALVALATPAAAAPAITEPAARALVDRQEAAWNARDATGFAATFTADARFVDQAAKPGGGTMLNGQSSLAQAVAYARKFFARPGSFRETMTVDRVEIAADGRSARVLSHGQTRLAPKAGPPRTLCAQREQTLALDHGRLKSRGQTDTQVRCPH